MNQKSNNEATQNDLVFHVRRCHICDCVTETSGSVVEKCQSCGKALAPFVFCESAYENQFEKLSEQIFKSTNQGLRSIYPPLMGIALYW
jgi:hypothetical protein